MSKLNRAVRQAAPLLGALAFASAATLVLGFPRWAVVGQLLGGNRPDVYAAASVSEALLWLVACCVALWWVARAARRLKIRPDVRVPDLRASVVVLVGGVVLLGIGVIRHQPEPTVVCCGTLSEATNAGH